MAMAGDQISGTIYVGSDHGGFALKEKLKAWLETRGFQVQDLGPRQLNPSDDYPPYAVAVAELVAADQASGVHSFGVLACRTGAGMVIASNKVPGIRAVEAHDVASAVAARQHNDANVLALAADDLSNTQAQEILEAWLASDFAGGRHERRLGEIERLEQERVQVIPGILESEWSNIEQKVKLVSPYVDWVQIDVADGTLVPNTTFLDPTPFATLGPKPQRELHLMVKEPTKYVAPWIAAGFRRLIAHVESEGVDEFLRLVRAHPAGAEVGLAIDLATPVERLRPWLEQIDVVLVMGVKAGFSGQSFDWAAVDKIVALHTLKPDLALAVDGGMNEQTVPVVVAAGASRVVATSYLFNQPNVAEALAKLQHAGHRS